ncbi:hypothetical protein [Micromonospora sp. KC721]|uniref:hypothetical protein n=1 Tax=Micromonospora sp. KC721 TaxID=2530380 RepID=UPI00104D1F7F|nr:hypothetical protein [Micromonospora sp. KC721]TDB81963.1 hypothetical protein E1182_03240 [Micromonospora sp. KC721]
MPATAIAKHPGAGRSTLYRALQPVDDEFADGRGAARAFENVARVVGPVGDAVTATCRIPDESG